MSSPSSNIGTAGQLDAHSHLYHVPTMDVYYDSEMHHLWVYIELPSVPAKNVAVSIGPSPILQQNSIIIWGILLPPSSRVAIQPPISATEEVGSCATGMVFFYLDQQFIINNYNLFTGHMTTPPGSDFCHGTGTSLWQAPTLFS
ncbi:hypothetical protein GYMLUDRAFT_59416 [Collybiopsis luxurians FD-317 M1]|uniref:Uncharacterized protein n=1 Tax=Collybiopsis luxurians FD-317 M1 TaxID=944289 RepID=A0A0D0CDZ6_9AGAR|nr:hypothetical protein GYMLUDRAFT_59416 [Collybiopsis luxurians FD-317 M1]